MTKVPYSVRMALAIMGHNDDAVNRVVQEALVDIGNECAKVAMSYDMVDLPLVLAVMQIVTRGMTAILDKNGKELMEKIVQRTDCITIDAAEMRKQMEDDDDQDEKP